MTKQIKAVATMWIMAFIMAIGLMTIGLIKAGPAFGIWPFSDKEESNQEESSILNLNTASEDALAALPNVGAIKAQAIIAYRQQHGPFKTVEEVKQVPGIEEQTFASIKDRITVGEEKQSSSDKSATQPQARVGTEEGEE